MSRLQWFTDDLIEYSQEPPSRVSRRAKALLAGFTEFQDRRCDPETLFLMDRVLNERVGSRIARSVLKAELRSLLGNVLTRERLVQIVCALAGGYSDAAIGLSLGAFATDRPAQDCLARVEQVQLEESDTDRRLQFSLLVCNSAMAGGRLRAFLAFRSFAQWARLLGMVNRRSGVGCSTPRLFTGVEMIARLERLSGELQLVGVSCTPQLAARNYKLNRSRDRKHAACPFGAQHECHQCEVGRNQCLLSCSVIKTSYPLQRVTQEKPDGDERQADPDQFGAGD